MEDFNNNPYEPSTPEQPGYEQPVYDQPVYDQPSYDQPYYQEEGPVQPTVGISSDIPNPNMILVFGILSNTLFGLPFVNIAMMVLAILGLKKSKEYMESGAPMSGKVKAGRILSIIGLIANIIAVGLLFLFACSVCLCSGTTGLASLLGASSSMAY